MPGAAMVADLEAELAGAEEARAEVLRRQLAFMRETDMALVVSQAQNEVEDLRKKGADIAPHRARMQREDLDEKFKDAADPLRIVFVCAMWMTRFDVKSCSTIYLDKPMRNHTLMQTIARANRVHEDKPAWLIVDYIGVFDNLQQALAIYAAGRSGEETRVAEEAGEFATAADSPIQSKEALVEELRDLVARTDAFLRARGVDLDRLDRARGFERTRLYGDAVEALQVEDVKEEYLGLARAVEQLFTAILPDRRANEFVRRRMLIGLLAEPLRQPGRRVDVEAVMADVEGLLDASVVVGWFTINAPGPGSTEHLVDLSQLDFEELRAQFEAGRKRTAAEQLKGQVNGRLARMVRLNRSRMDYQAQLQRMIDDYNTGASSVDAFFAHLVSFTRQLTVEEQRALAEGLSEEELAVFDLLTRPEPALDATERAQVKEAARELLQTLKRDKLVSDWRNKQPSRAAVLTSIRDTLDSRLLVAPYPRAVYDAKVDAVYQHVFDTHYGDGRSVYAQAG